MTRQTVRSHITGAAGGLVVLGLLVASPLPAAWAQPAGSLQPPVAAMAGNAEAAERQLLPRLLSTEDATRYRQIFAAQEAGRWKAADALLAEVTDRRLLGHVLAQRYLHPTHYRSRYRELRDWLASYSDLPQAPRIYKLALKRQPAGAAALRRPVSGVLKGSGHEADRPLRTHRPVRNLSAADAKRLKKHRRVLRRAMREGWTLTVKRTLEDKATMRLFHPVEEDRLRTDLATVYLGDGHVEWALKWAGAAAERSGTWVPKAHWVAGLASWQLGNFDHASDHFAKVAEAGDYASPWMRAAGGFWAARAALRAGSPETVSRWLAMAANLPHTFYGLLARHVLGLPEIADWRLPPLNADDLAVLGDYVGGGRALALLQLEQDSLAEGELRALNRHNNSALRRVSLALAVRSNMPGLAMRLDSALRRQGEPGWDAAAYPLPQWQPSDSYIVDRALVFAIARQESGFNPKAQSWAGARGLMQLMPSTASFIAKDRSLRRGGKRRLFDPRVNLVLGQRYLDKLLTEPPITGDLFKAMAAWNGGPGNLNLWLRQLAHNDDPLLFIEIIPAPETRSFIERVLANLWIYRSRFGQPHPSLATIASGQWPGYTSLDHRPLRTSLP